MALLRNIFRSRNLQRVLFIGIVLMLVLTTFSGYAAASSRPVTRSGLRLLKADAKAGRAGTVLPRKVPVLMYHHFTEQPENSAMVSPGKMRRDLEKIRDMGYSTISFEDLYRHLAGEKTIPEKSLIISVDDGYLSNYTVMYPVLKEMKMKASIAMIGWSVGRASSAVTGKKIIPHFNWRQAREMVRSGAVEMQNHTTDLHSPEGLSLGAGRQTGEGVLPMSGEMPDRYRARLLEDWSRLNIRMKEEGIPVPGFLVYPYGKNCEASEAAADEMFAGTVTTQPGIRTYRSMEDIKKIPRLNVSEEDDLEMLILRASEGDLH